MTGGQCSSTTPRDVVVGSGFLNRLEKPMDICHVAEAAGTGYISRVSTYDKSLAEGLKEAIAFEGFSLVDIWGICPGRYTRRNKLTPKSIEADLAMLPELNKSPAQNARLEYGRAYRQEAARLSVPAEPVRIEAAYTPPLQGRWEVMILGSAGQRIITAGELLCLAGASAGCHASQKNDYPITVMRGHSVSEIIISTSEIDYTGIENPSIVLALANEGVNRQKKMIEALSPKSVIITATGVNLPRCQASIIQVDFKAMKIKAQDCALAALAVLSQHNTVLTMDMLRAALKLKFKEPLYSKAISVAEQVTA